MLNYTLFIIIARRIFVCTKKKDHICNVLRFSDIHTHTPGRPDSVLSISSYDVEQVLSANKAGEAPQHYSLQLHPWHVRSAADIDAFIEKARALADDPCLVAIGECGLDGLCETPAELQRQAFEAALDVADELGKPVVIHCVRMWQEMLVLTHGHRSEMIVHGFRKGPELAEQLVKAGFSISIGKRYNPDILQVVPAERLYHETDEL